MKKRIAEMMIMMLLTGMLMLAFDIKQAGSSEPSARQPTNQRHYLSFLRTHQTQNAFIF